MDDVIDRRTRLIYASLADRELVRQLEEAHRAATQHRRSRPRAASATVRQRPVGARPWVPTPSAAPIGRTDVVSSGVPTSGEADVVVDLREPARSTTHDAAPSQAHPAVGRQQSSQCATDDPSYYLG